jgi:hypothetical protein
LNRATINEVKTTKLNGIDGESSFLLSIGSSMFSGIVSGALIPSELTALTHIV